MNPSTLTWTAIAEAQNYQVILKSESQESTDVREEVQAQQTSLQLPVLQPGRYVATVTAADRFGISSVPSNPAIIRVVGVELPEGAYVYRGVPQIGREQQIHLTHADGLEMAYGSGTIFGPAPDWLGVSTGHVLVTRFREKGSLDEITLKLEPRSLRSSVEFLPHSAHWPGQSIKVQVRILGPDGTALPDSVAVSMNTTVNAKPIDASWERDGNIWTAQVDQPPIPGPWILRVTASDQVGQVLARDFIEIALPSKSSVPGSQPKYSRRF
jgi:hypothetical protein